MEFSKGVELVYFLVKKLKEEHPNKQVGKTIIQKLMYIYEQKSNIDLDYELYHYGPYSSTVSQFLEIGRSLGLVNISWKPGSGYFIETSGDKEIKNLSEEEKRIIKNIVENYGEFTANELSIIATALYIKNRFKITSPEDLVSHVLSIKPRNKKEWVKKLLIKAGVIEGESN